MIIIGIDPGIERTGYGVIEKLPKSKLHCITYGCVTTPRDKNRAERLLLIEKELSLVLKETKPLLAAVESLFFFKNLKTVMPVSEARGVALLTLARKKIPIYEFTPPQVKMAITGYGRAEKKQIQAMVKEMLNLDEIPRPDDAADGLGLAIACSFALTTKAPLQ